MDDGDDNDDHRHHRKKKSEKDQEFDDLTCREDYNNMDDDNLNQNDNPVEIADLQQY
jgi:hypothetical protein